MNKNIITLLVVFLFSSLLLPAVHAEQTVIDLPHPKGVNVRLTFPDGEVDRYVEEIQSHSGYDYNVKILQIPYISSQYPYPVSATGDISVFGGEGSWLLTSSSNLGFDPRTLLTGSSYLETEGSTFNFNSSRYYRVQYDYGYLYFTIRGGIEPLEITADPPAIRPDGNSTSTLTVKALNDQGNPMAGISIELEEPDSGILLPLTGTTGANGEFKTFYTAPYDEDTEGAGSVEIVALDATRGMDAVTHITFNRASISFLAHPNMNLSGDFPEDMAIIPPDESFPARYQLTLYNGPGEPAVNKTLTVRLSDKTRAGLVGDGDGEIEITTDAQGNAEFSYQYTGAVPQTEPLIDEITVSCDELYLVETVKVSVGLRMEIVSVQEIWEADGEMPEKLGLLVELHDAFRPEMDLVAYWVALEAATEKVLGARITTEWLNPPHPGFFDNIKDYLPDFVSFPDNEFYDGPAQILKAGDKTIADACAQPNKVSAEYLLPAIVFQGPGMNFIRVTARPVILEDCGNGTYQNLPSPRGTEGQMLVAMVFESESVFRSLTCSFQPTDEKQFLAKALYLDNPFFKTAAYVGTGVAVPVGLALQVVDVANLFCDILKGNYVGAAGTVLSKYNNSFTDQIEKLINEGAPLTKNQATAFLMSKTAQFTHKGISAAADAKKHFGKKTTLSVIDPEDWPEDISAEAFFRAVTHANAGLLSSPVLKGWEIVAVVNGSEMTLTDDQGNEITENVYRIQEDGITVFVLPEKEGYFSMNASEEGLELFRYVKKDAVTVEATLYTVSGQGRVTLDLSAGISPPGGVDRDNDGTVDETVFPETLTVTINPSGDGEVSLMDVILALQVSGGIVPEAYLHAGADVNGDSKIALEEAIYFLGVLSGLR